MTEGANTLLEQAGQKCKAQKTYVRLASLFQAGPWDHMASAAVWAELLGGSRGW